MGMENTGWHLRDLDTSRIAFGYMGSDTSPHAVQSDSIFFRKISHFGVPGYPEGMLRTTMQDLARFVSAFLNKGIYRGYQMLRPETAELMLAPNHIEGIPSRTNKALDIGLTWLLEGTGDDQAYTMNGFSGSIFTDVHFWPKEKAAILFYFTGIRMKTMPAAMDITKKLTNAVRTVEPS